jgi:endonuclease/exonuclease/phosphatase family metal-dependent hydrolase
MGTAIAVPFAFMRCEVEQGHWERGYRGYRGQLFKSVTLASQTSFELLDAKCCRIRELERYPRYPRYPRGQLVGMRLPVSAAVLRTVPHPLEPRRNLTLAAKAKHSAPLPVCSAHCPYRTNRAKPTGRVE